MGHELVNLATISCLGSSRDEILPKLFTPGIDTLTLSSDFLRGESCYVGMIKAELPQIPRSVSELDSRFARIVFTLYLELEKEVMDLKRIFGADRIGIVFASSTSGIDKSEAAFRDRGNKDRFPEWFTFFNQEIGAGSALLSRLSGCTGPSYTISTACSSGGKVFESARLLLDLGVCDAVILGGADALCQMTLRGFKSLDLVSGSKANPMSRNRCGLNIGEGGALFIMLKGDCGIQLKGVGESCDAYHISSPEPEGRGAEAAILGALKRSGESSFDRVKYLNLHGTATVLNDLMESRAVHRLFGDSVPCSSTKPLTGHLLGACGALEAGFLFYMLESGPGKIRLPLHIWDNERDPELPSVSLVSTNTEIDLGRGDLLLSSSFAFGGNNCCVSLGFGREMV
ncbi:MAG TPA: beta-ketoacyl synthase N-terminal-like domain-containing protein [Oligoflexia bacterium]|nr:beta-ketoacyl synthase N-terminal-like domain-containing protein [Oligoflexia bacterium]